MAQKGMAKFVLIIHVLSQFVVARHIELASLKPRTCIYVSCCLVLQLFLLVGCGWFLVGMSLGWPKFDHVSIIQDPDPERQPTIGIRYMYKFLLLFGQCSVFLFVFIVYSYGLFSINIALPDHVRTNTSAQFLNNILGHDVNKKLV